MIGGIPRRLEPRALAVATRGLSKRCPGRRVLAGLELTVPEGAVFALAGPNGPGKTTTPRILLDLARADAGGASLMGHDSAGDGARARACAGYLA